LIFNDLKILKDIHLLMDTIFGILYKQFGE